MSTWTPIAITDECTTCGVCGRDGLKKTVVFESELGEYQFLGCDCAAKLAARQGKKDSKAFAAGRIERTIRAMRSALKLVQDDLDKAISARDAGRVHPQGLAWEESIAIRTRNLNAVKAQYGLTLAGSGVEVIA